MRLPIRFAAVLLIPLALAATARAGDSWWLTRADLKPAQVTLQRAGADGVHIESAGATETVPWPAVVELRNGVVDPAIDRAAPQWWTLRLTDHSTLHGDPVATTHGDHLTWSSPSLSRIGVPLSNVAALTWYDNDAPPAGGIDDQIKLRNGDAVHGAVTDVSADAITLTNADGQATPIPLPAVAGVRFANPPAKSNRASAAVRLTTKYGETFDATNVSFDGTTWRVIAFGDQHALSTDDVRILAPRDGPVAWLADRPPPTIAYTPFLNEHFPPKLNAGVADLPVEVDGQPARHLIGVHARTVLTWDVADAGYRNFRTQYAAAPGDTLTAAVARVRVDDRVVYESAVRPGPPSPIVTADLAGAKTLSLEVDFPPSGYPAQARVNWIAPALVRDPPATTRP